MSARRNDFDGLYLNRLDTRDPNYLSQSVWERLQQPTVLISGCIILFTILGHIYGSSILLENLFYWCSNLLWDTFVYVTPLPVIKFIDSWLNSSQPMLDSSTATNASKSAMMQRALGLDRTGGMMSSVFQARNRALSMTGSALGLKLESDRPPGLGNHDNSCFQNSILQGLASLNAFPAYLSACLQNADPDDEPSRVVTQTLRALLAELNDSSNFGRTLWTPHKLKFMSTWTQQDAQEYYSKILDDIDRGAAKTLKALKKQTGFETDTSKDDASASQHSDDSGYQSMAGSPRVFDPLSFRNPLEGLLAQRVSCVQCGHSDGLSMIPFNCLTLSLSLDRRRHDLYERLDAYSDIESIPGVECPKCTLLKAQRLLRMIVERLRDDERTEEQLAEPLRRLEAVGNALEEDMFDEKTIRDECKISPQGKVSTTKTKQVVIARPPQSLAVHINRSVFDPATFNTVKNSAPVEFPATLDLGPWCLGSADTLGESDDSKATSGAGSDDINIVEQWQLDPTASMIAGDSKPSRLTGPIYELRAVVTHYGRHENGHYICYRKHPHYRIPENILSKTNSISSDDHDVGDDEQHESTSAQADSDHSLETTKTSEMDWWRLSDHNVSKVDKETIANLAPGVFMLFYECIDPSMILQDATETTVSSSSESDTESAFESAGSLSDPRSIENGTLGHAQAMNDAAGSVRTPSDSVALPVGEKEDAREGNSG